MSVKAVLRFVTHRIGRHPDSEVTVTARCLNPDCAWEVSPTADLAQADVDCMAHKGLTGHAIFARTFEDIAVVVPVEQDSAPGR
ncbi:hypothetical protein ACFUGD_01100 [Streptomyces sp. NPDC057217]|uniref:DUF7848 domain-containing protein n=1 Tax=Streptomyces sp. NPDC057217 TaxID=3346054 RepID=UPI0036261366